MDGNKRSPRHSVCCFTRWPLGLLFLYSGGIKLIEWPRFAEHVGGFGVVYDSLAKPTALVICVIELAVGMGTLANLRGSLLAVGGLLLCFIAILLYGMSLGLDIECGCFGTGYGLNLRSQLFVDVFLLGWCSLAYWSCRKCDPPGP